MQKNNECLGCGAIKQTDDINKVGYVKDITHDYCIECHTLKNYGKTTNHFHPNNYLDIKPNSTILIIQSIMQLDLLFTQPIERIQPNARHIYIINQIDLLPHDVNLDFIYKKVKLLARKNKVKHSDIIFMSAINEFDLTSLKSYLLSLKSSDIYLFGFQNSGKTTILKGLTNNKSALNINKAGLTQNIITDVLENKVIYDMPGNYVKGYLADFFTYEQYKNLLPSKTINPKVYVLTSKQKFVVNDFIEITISSKENATLIFYLNKNNQIKRYNLLNENNYLNNELTYQMKTFKTNNKKSHLSIADLGFILINDNISVTIKYPKGMHVTMMESLIK